MLSDPKGETHPDGGVVERVIAPAMPNAPMVEMRLLVIRPPPRPDWTNPVPMVGTSLKFMPRTNSAPLRYIGQSSTNLVDWQTFTNAILDGEPHWFYFHVLDDGSENRFFRVVWQPAL